MAAVSGVKDGEDEGEVEEEGEEEEEGREEDDESDATAINFSATTTNKLTAKMAKLKQCAILLPDLCNKSSTKTITTPTTKILIMTATTNIKQKTLAESENTLHHIVLSISATWASSS